jgi:glycosyltransferase involved in cell wall biosynthesis
MTTNQGFEEIDLSQTDLLLAGPLPIEGDVIGGTKVSFGQLVMLCRGMSFGDLHVVNTSRALAGRVGFGVLMANIQGILLLLVAVARYRRKSNQLVVLFNASPGGALLATPFLFCLCRFRNARLIVRLFGGDFDRFYNKLSRLNKGLVRFFVFGADTVLLQTESLVTYFQEYGEVIWFPTTRNMPSRKKKLRRGCRKFLFLGQLRLEKGLQEILASAPRLPPFVSVSLAGPAMQSSNLEGIPCSENVKFLGVVENDSVPALLEDHDALLFPSYWEGEGYPGVLIEALQMGLPVIATDWMSLPEIVKDERSGLIISTQSVVELSNAMKRLVEDDELFHRLQIGAKERGDCYRSHLVIDTLERCLKRILVEGK